MENIMQSITVAELRDSLDEILKIVKNGQSILITDNGHILAEFKPVERASRQKPSRPRLIRTKEEFDVEMARLDQAFQKGELSMKDCYLSKLEPIDMGQTDSSNLDPEIYK